MPIAHTCATCGAELSRVRAGLDTRLGLQVVTCPACSTPCVRRRDPIARVVRRSLLLVDAAGVMLVYGFVTLTLTGLSFAVTGALLEDASHTSLREVLLAMSGLRPDAETVRSFIEDHDGKRDLLLALCVGVLTGLWLRICLPHQPLRWVPWMFHVAALLGCFVLRAMFVAEEALVRGGRVETAQEALQRVVSHDHAMLTEGLPTLLLAAFLGAPVGWLLARGVLNYFQGAPRRRFFKHLKRARKVRVA